MELKLRPNRLEYTVPLIICLSMSAFLFFGFVVLLKESILQFKQGNEEWWGALIGCLSFFPFAILLFLFAICYMYALIAIRDVYEKEKMYQLWGKKTRFEIKYSDILYIYGEHCFLEIGCKAPYQKKGKEVKYVVGYSKKEEVSKAMKLILNANPNIEVRTEGQQKRFLYRTKR